MDDIGKILREARQQLGKSLEQVHDETRVSIQHLQYLEENNFTFLPDTYVKSFLKTYADSLGLDSAEIVNSYQTLRGKKTVQQIVGSEDEDEGSDEVQIITDPSAATEKPKRVMHLRPERRLVEYGLGFGSFLLLVGLIFGYLQYRSHIYAHPVEDLTYRQVDIKKEVADIAVNSVSGEATSAAARPFQLEVTAKDNVWIQIVVDGKTAEVRMAPQERRVWIAQNGIKLDLGRLEERKRRESQNGSRRPQGAAVVSFSLSSDDVHE